MIDYYSSSKHCTYFAIYNTIPIIQNTNSNCLIIILMIVITEIWRMMEDKRKRVSRGTRLNVGMLDDNKKWVQKFSRSRYDYRATALDGSPWHLPFSHRSVVHRVLEIHMWIPSFSMKFASNFSLPNISHKLNSRIQQMVRIPSSELSMNDTKPIYRLSIQRLRFYYLTPNIKLFRRQWSFFFPPIHSVSHTLRSPRRAN